MVSLKANWMAERGHAVAVISVRRRNEHPFFPFSDRVERIHLGLPSIREKSRPLFVAALTDCLRTLRPDVVCSTGMKVLNYLCEVEDGSVKILESHFSKYKRRQWLGALEGSWPGRRVLSCFFRKSHRLARRYDRVVVLTGEDRRSWMCAGFGEVTVIPNPLTFVPEGEAALTRPEVVAVGHYKNQKGLDRLIANWSRVAPRFPQWRLTLYGDGPLRELLARQIGRLKIGRQTVLHPPVKEIQAIYRESSVFVMTSRYEGLPMVLLEAMASGVPPVVYACKSGPRDLIRDGENGFLVRNGDRRHFCHCLSRLMEDPALRRSLGRQAARDMQAFRIDPVMQRWLALFDELLRFRKI